jgi:hypothetical protein
MMWFEVVVELYLVVLMLLWWSKWSWWCWCGGKSYIVVPDPHENQFSCGSGIGFWLVW